MRIFLLSLLLVCLSCKSQKKGAKNNAENIQMDQPILVLEDYYSNIDSSQVSIIKDQKALHKFFVQVNKTRKPGLPVPIIDFSKEMLILICAGEQRGKYEHNLTIMEGNTDKMIVNVEETILSRSNETGLSTPFFLYKLPLTEREITFIKE